MDGVDTASRWFYPSTLPRWFRWNEQWIWGDPLPIEEYGIYGYPFPPPDPQHPQHLGKYETKLRSDPQQSRNKAATKAQQKGQQPSQTNRTSEPSIPPKIAKNPVNPSTLRDSKELQKSDPSGSRQKASTSRQSSQFWPFWLRLAFDSELPDNCPCVDGDPTN
jgi:hypothetical protein